MNTVSACLICKNEKSNIALIIGDLCPVLEEVHITDTGSTDGTLEILKSQNKIFKNLFIHHFDWVDDFSAARNFSFSHGKNTDWVFWVDCDDRVDSKKLAKFKKEMLGTPSVDIWKLPYIYGPHLTLPRERFIRRSIVHYWKGAIHEYIHTERARDCYYAELSVVHNHVGKLRESGRNVRILEKEFAKDPTNDRTAYYFGRDLFDSGEKTRGAEILEHYLKLSCWKYHEDEIRARFILAGNCLEDKKYTEALKVIEPVYHLDPSRRRAEYYYIFGEVEKALGNLSVAADWYVRCLCKPPESGIVNHSYWTSLPLMKLVLCYRDLGMWDKVSEYSERLKGYSQYRDLVVELSSYILHPKPSSNEVVLELGTSELPHSYKAGKEPLLVNTGNFIKFQATNWVFNKSLPFITSSIDGIVADLALFEEMPVGEYFRVIKPGGFLWTTSPVEHGKIASGALENGFFKYIKTSGVRVAAAMTTCRRPHLFKLTYDSFQTNCLDRDMMKTFYVVDDFSPEGDLAAMRAAAPTAKFLAKTEKGHAHSINALIKELLEQGFEFLVFMEDDFIFIKEAHLIRKAVDIIRDDPRIGQVIFNKNYAESDCEEEDEHVLVCGEHRVSKNGGSYILHEYRTGQQLHDFYKNNPGRMSHTHWPHFSLNNGVWNLNAISNVGLITTFENFEHNYGLKYSSYGYKTAYLPEVHCIHLGKPRRGILKERPRLRLDMLKRHGIDDVVCDSTAYDLNNTKR